MLLLALLWTVLPAGESAQAPATVRVEVRRGADPVAGADVVVNGMTQRTGADGIVSVAVAPGTVEITVVKDGFAPVSSRLKVAAGRTQPVLVDLAEEPRIEDDVIVSATRTDRRLEDQPMRVEVVPGEEVQEKIMMTPGDVSMLLAETNGLRVQTTSPSLGGANVRIQGMRGRYTQILADGLPLYGGQTGSIGLLQIPPMDLGQVEVIKGVASALYGMSAIGGVINLVSRRPPEAPPPAASRGQDGCLRRHGRRPTRDHVLGDGFGPALDRGGSPTGPSRGGYSPMSSALLGRVMYVCRDGRCVGGIGGAGVCTGRRGATKAGTCGASNGAAMPMNPSPDR